MHEDHEHLPDPLDPSIDESNWLEESYPLVDADFVGETLERVLRDRDEIAEEAARVEEIQFDRNEFATFAVPEPSPGFVDATLARVLAQRAAAGAAPEDAAMHRVLRQYAPPAPSADFVGRTLSAVRGDRGSRASPVPLRRPWQRPFSIAVSTAALVLCGVFWWLDRSPRPTQEPHRVRPASFGSLVGTSDAPASRLTAFEAKVMDFGIDGVYRGGPK